ncbi:hypothetical protein U1Q18_014533 [Sarracenia purpurea var. burkii]
MAEQSIDRLKTAWAHCSDKGPGDNLSFIPRAVRGRGGGRFQPGARGEKEVTPQEVEEAAQAIVIAEATEVEEPAQVMVTAQEVEATDQVENADTGQAVSAPALDNPKLNSDMPVAFEGSSEENPTGSDISGSNAETSPSQRGPKPSKEAAG